MSIRTFFADLAKGPNAGDDSAPPAEPATTPADTPAGDDGSQNSADDDTPPADVDAGQLEDVDAGQLEDVDAGQLEDVDAGQLEDVDAGQLEDVDAGQLEDVDAGQLEDVDALARRLHSALVQLDGRVSDPAAVPYDPAHLDGDGAELTAAIDEVVENNPAARSRQYGGDIGAGNRGSTPAAPVDLIQLMRGA